MIQLVVRAIIHQNGKYLLTRNKGHEFWSLPGGGVKPEESIVQALERELIEELGVRPLVGQLLYVQQLVQPGEWERVEFFFLVNNPEAYQAVDISKTSHGAAELDGAQFCRLHDVTVLPAFLPKQLPGLLKSYAPSNLPQFFLNKLSK